MHNTQTTGTPRGCSTFVATPACHHPSIQPQEHRQTKLNAKETFSFSPEITKKAKQSRSSGRCTQQTLRARQPHLLTAATAAPHCAGPRSQRLYEQGVSSAAKLAAQRAAAEEASKPSFRPHINKRPVSGGNFSKRLAVSDLLEYTPRPPPCSLLLSPPSLPHRCPCPLPLVWYAGL